MNNEYARVILDSRAPNGKRITTLEVKYWRAIHAEVMTHRVFSRNAASSRAIPFEKHLPSGAMHPKCTLGMMQTDSFIPEYIGMEQKGMQSGESIDALDILKAQDMIEEMRNIMVDYCKRLAMLGIHKSIINRYLEPWSYITVVITATEWDNFFNLRCHPAAEKHLQKIARLMQHAMANSTPTPLQIGDWHLPYIVPGEDVDDILLSEAPGIHPDAITSKLIEISTARCARVSYMNQDGVRNIAKDLELYSRLRNPGDGVMHASPFEHAATPALDAETRSGNFKGWHQHRKSIPGEDGVR